MGGMGAHNRAHKFSLLFLLLFLFTRLPSRLERGGRGLEFASAPLPPPASNMASSLTVNGTRPSLSRVTTGLANGGPAPPVTIAQSGASATDAVLELSDGTAYRGISFGAEGKSVAGECVFQTGEQVSMSSDANVDSSRDQAWWATPSH